MGQSPPGAQTNREARGLPLLNGPTEFGGRSPAAAQWTTEPTKLAEPGDILFCVRGSTTGRMNLADQTYCIGRGVAAIRGKAREDTMFLYAVMRNELPRLLSLTSGSVFPNLSTADLRGFAIPWLEPAARRAIADILGALDDKIESNRRLVAAGHRLADAMFDEVAPALAQASLSSLAAKEIVTYSDGYRTRSDQLGSPGLPILRVADMVGGPLRPRGDNIMFTFLSQSDSKCSSIGDVVVSTKGTVGRVRLISRYDVRLVYSPQVCFIRILNGEFLSPSIIHRWARSPSFASGVSGMQGQTDMAAYINLADFGRLVAPLGGVELPVSRAINELDDTIACAEQISRTLAALRDALLPELLSGRLRVPEARERVEAVV